MDDDGQQIYLSKADMRYMRMAHKKTTLSTHPQHQLAAVIVRGGAVISVACNHKQWGKHAEIRALRTNPARFKRNIEFYSQDLAGSTLYVVRNNWRCSAPCSMCRVVIKASGISTLVYIDQNNVIRKERVH